MKKQNLYQTDVRILGQILAAQNALFDLPTEKQIAEFYTTSLSSLPGVSACQVCLGHCYSEMGGIHNEPCKECRNNRVADEKIVVIPEEFQCELENLQDSIVFTIRTPDYRFGVLVFALDQAERFDPYKPLLHIAISRRILKSMIGWGSTDTGLLQFNSIFPLNYCRT
ncbi:MAG: hypothetical protein HQ517_10615, partial [SAR324 cluster bacterium]|nr:hypothetical protein [SAR324 cluster bacterium]